MTISEKVWKIPEPVFIHEVRMEDGTVIILRRHGNTAGPRLVLCHGNGLATDFYYPFWSLLTEDFDLILYDLRNHGWNAVSSQKAHNIPTFVEDHDRILEAIDSYFGRKTQIGVFHSVSALTTLLSPTHGTGFSARILFDPPVCKPDERPEEFDVATRRCIEMTQRRTDWFESIEECVDFLRYIPTFSRVVPGAFELYASSTLRACANGRGYELRCPRDYEAQVFYHARAFAVMVEFEKFRCPTKVIGADPTLPHSFLPTVDLSRLLHVDYDFLPGATHLLQLEQPKECVRMMRDFLELHHLLD